MDCSLHSPSVYEILQARIVEWVSIPFSRRLPDLSPTDCHFLKHLNNFCKENAFTTSRREKMLSKSLLNPETQIFMLQE